MFGRYPDKEAPVQIYHLNEEGQRCQLASPAKELATRIHYYWELDIEATACRLDVIPDAAVDVVINPAQPDFSVAYLPSPTLWHLQLNGPVRYLGICMPATRVRHNLGQMTQSLGALTPGAETTSGLGLEPITGQITAETTLSDFVSHCDEHFLSLSREIESDCPDLKKLSRIQALINELEAGQIATIAARWHVSERQLRRQTADWIGMSPKKIQTVQRLQNTLTELLEGGPSERDDFYDEAHRIRELRRLTGLTPGEIRKMAEKYNAK